MKITMKNNNGWNSSKAEEVISALWVIAGLLAWSVRLKELAFVMFAMGAYATALSLKHAYQKHFVDGPIGVSIAWTSWENTPDRARIVRKEDGRVFAMAAFPDGILLTNSIYGRPLKAAYSCLAEYTKLDGTPCATHV